jgi:hypothetical protein
MHPRERRWVIHRRNATHHNELRDTLRQKSGSSYCRWSTTGHPQNTKPIDPEVRRHKQNIISPILNPSFAVPI